ncbi:hypothetical protein PR048_026699 [Dryococelus australis]|uniref:Uncharacterized protein n=1 Tax=Dryococelus australis TaxID=614101 RepID=A0ABQ9GM42_9NEOP|nr:hypothetical protein PR048_026699 [Dryococelus australis]
MGGVNRRMLLMLLSLHKKKKKNVKRCVRPVIGGCVQFFKKGQQKALGLPISYLFQIGHCTVSKIIAEICNVL